MLKITLVETPSEQRLVLEGKLAGPDLLVLQSAWEHARGTRRERKSIIDLRNATFIDSGAEPILLDMKRHGAHFLACGVCTKHQLEQLGI